MVMDTWEAAMDAAESLPLPQWATGLANGEFVTGAALPTKDGRRCGNAAITNIYPDAEFTTIYEVLTDAGNHLSLTEAEVRELFHPPEYVMDLATAPGLAHRVPEGWKLIKTSTHDERSFPDDPERYQCKCAGCGRGFSGMKSRHQCRVCETNPPVMHPEDIERSRAEATAIMDRMVAVAQKETCRGD